MAYLNKNNLPGVIALIDFEKCFDHVEISSLKEILRYFNFGEKFIAMVSLLYSGFQVCTSSNGYLSDLFFKGRGLNQDDPASPAIYTLCGEILNHLVKQNSNIKGVPIPFLENILSQFADDTGAFLSYDPITISAFTDTLQNVETLVGLKVSYNKTTMYRVGSIKNSDVRIYTTKEYKWDNGPMETLGMLISCTGEQVEANFEQIMQKVHSVCRTWYNHSLTLCGKVLIINTLVGSLFVYRLSTMLDLTLQQIQQFESEIRDFLWNDKNSPVTG